MNLDPQTLGAIGALLTAGLGFIAGRRIRSGKVSTTDADRLWAEAARLRADLTDQLATVRLEVHQKNERIEHLEAENQRLSGRVTELERELLILRGDI